MRENLNEYTHELFMDQKIDPWSSKTIKNYKRVFEEFGIERIGKNLRKKFPHFFFRRGIVIGHRDLEKIAKRVEKNQPFINITGIATSGKFHFGHKIIIDLFKFFKELGGISYFAICDIDAYISRPDRRVPSLARAKEYAVENLSYILALGLTEKDIYVQSKKEQRYYEFAFEISKKITESVFKAVYGHLHLGKIGATLLQFADILHPQLPEYEGKMPSITIVGIDQDPHMRLVRDLTRRLPYNFELPSVLITRHLEGLQPGTKMSSSDQQNTIFLSDDPKVAVEKIIKAFDGGRPAKEQRKEGGRPHICKVYDFAVFNYESDKKLNEMYYNCKAGNVLCYDCKCVVAEFLEKLLTHYQKKVKQTVKLAKKIVYG